MRLAWTACLLVALTVPAVVMASPIKVNVPFAFDAGEVSLPAGHYEVQRMYSGGAVNLRNLDGTKSIVLMALPAGNPAEPKPPCLVFEKTGGYYRLVEVRGTGSDIGVPTPKNKQYPMISKRDRDVERIEISASFF